MSVVLAYANEDTAIIAGDGRVIDANNNIYSEQYEKVKKINDRVIIGYAGEVTPCECISLLLTKEENRDTVSGLYVEDIVNFIEMYYKTMPPETKVGFLICGIAKNSKICAASTMLGQKSEIIFPSNKEPFYCGLYPGDIPEDMDVFKKYLLTNKEPLDAMASTISFCAGLSLSVNRNMTYYCVQSVRG